MLDLFNLVMDRRSLVFPEGRFVCEVLSLAARFPGRQDHTSQDYFCSVIDEFPV